MHYISMVFKAVLIHLAIIKILNTNIHGTVIINVNKGQ